MVTFIVLILLAGTLSSEIRVEWCKYTDKIVCVPFNKGCGPNYQWSLSTNRIQLPVINEGFIIDCKLNTQLEVTINFKFNFVLNFDRNNNKYTYSQQFDKFTFIQEILNNKKIVKNKHEVLKTSCNNCKQCDLYNNCEKCNDGYYLYNNSCYTCDSSCRTCNGKKQNSCLSCPFSYGVSNGYCVKCDASCLECNGSGPNNCISCFKNYYLTSGYCSKCDLTCNECNGPNANNCISCNPYYYYSNGYCLKCGYSCIFCNFTKPEYCLFCDLNFYNSNGYCLKCDQNCNGCGGTADNCTHCNDGFYLNNGSCIQGTLNCKKFENSICISCIPYYYLSDNVCNKCHSECYNCNGPEKTNCTTCPNGKYVDKTHGEYNHTCQPCIENCKTCENSINCYECENGYYLSNGECVKFDNEYCASINNSKCISCVFGYYLDKNDCLKCPDVCISCFGPTINQCENCIDGIILHQTRAFNVLRRVKHANTIRPYVLLVSQIQGICGTMSVLFVIIVTPGIAYQI
ncbi:hypothetical protein EIN_040370 [Entamoeba invadens IP1]|uniref:CXXC-rich protein n=1 Tax=Entamoeba invadens IP1 TaxID=370355 RepID=A0A0A1TZ44_ENTIV|nr:hypothetical protein EIN_040370 [Entamoeba invadens IP1]ELP85483.1 hypothetical protein EIN_040370 [Entamoeba invadens IP1]|eukprot:XP_004184829.1 hypothetical protein EIN_040370 [Entamoeba invadens IP1]